MVRWTSATANPPFGIVKLLLLFTLGGRRIAPTEGVAETFTQKFILMCMAAFFAACFFWFYRHIVNEALWECHEGWRESLQGKTWMDTYLEDYYPEGDGSETASARE